jgi:hypothetical protein
MPTADWYRRKADECISLAKAAILNRERAGHYALAEHYMRLAMDELNRSGPIKGRSRWVTGSEQPSANG